MADHFLTKSQIDLGDCLSVGGTLALESHGALHQILTERVSPAAAALFAEPLINRGNDVAGATISWYVDVPGEGTPLAGLDEAIRSRIGAILSREFRAMRALLDDPEDGPLVAAALHVLGSPAGDIWVVNNNPVIINWGMTPKNIRDDLAARTAHFGATMGRFLPLSVAPPLNEEERRNRREHIGGAAEEKAEPMSEAVPAAAVAIPAAAAAVGAAAAADDTDRATSDREPRRTGERRPVPLIAWLPLLILLLVALATLIWLLLPGTRIFPDNTIRAAQTQEALTLAREVNAGLEARRNTLRTALDGAMCEIDGTLVMPDGFTMDGILPPVMGNPADAPGMPAPASATPVMPPNPERVVVPAESGMIDGATGDVSLLDLIETRTVMVVADGARDSSTGSGFFIGPDLVVTNFHVIEGMDPGNLFVTNKALGTLRQAQLVKYLGPFEATGADFALLRVSGVRNDHFTLLNSRDSLKLQSVVSAGYPGDLLETDAAFWSLRNGDAGAVPELSVTDGTVITEQALSASTHTVVHSAPISQGNSGGPLVDMCGRVVGVNTFVRQGDLRNLNFALSTSDLLAFLSDTGASITSASEVCEPQLLRTIAPPRVADAQTAPVDTGAI